MKMTFLSATKRALPGLTPLLLGTCLMAVSRPADAQSLSPDPKPNILVITVDDLNDFTGFLNGQSQTFTPNMDRLANSGTVFLNAFTAVPVCAPSRNCFLTGKAAGYSGIFSNEQYLLDIEPSKRFRSLYDELADPLQVVTIPEWFKDAGGYYTFGMGKVFHGWKRDGFDRDFDEATLDPCTRGLSWNDFVDFNPKDDPRPDPGLAGDFGDGVENVSAGRLPDAEEMLMMDYKQASTAVQFLSDYGSNPGNFCNRPFFMHVGMYRPHEPFTAPEKYFLPEYNPDLYQRPYDLPYNFPPDNYPPNGLVMPNQPNPVWGDYDNLTPVGQLMANGLGTHDNFQQFPNQLDSIPRFADTLTLAQRKQIVSESRRATSIMAYLASIRYVDAQVGRILDALEANPQLAANTVIVLFSDHGFSLGEKRHWFKNALWETDIRVPMAIRDPRVMGGSVQTAPVSLLDVFPTLCDLAGIPEPTTDSGDRYLDGRSLRSGLNSQPIPGFKPAVSTIRLPDRFPVSCYPMYSVRTERYHLLRYRTPLGSNPCSSGLYEDIFELYEIGEDRDIDPNEWNNLANAPNYKRVRDWLRQFIPGEPLAGTVQPVVKINIPELDCAPFTPSSVLRLWASINTEGTGKTPGDYVLRWSVNNIKTVLGGDSVALHMSNFPASWFSNPTEVVIHLAAINSEGKVVSMDNAVIRLGDEIPDPTFSTSLWSNGQLRVDPLIDFPQSGSDFSRWDFGDGIVLDQRQPDPHQYQMPGTYSVIHSRIYGSNRHCVVTDTQTVVVPDSLLGNTCRTPYPPLVQEVGPTSGRLSVSPVYQADYYQWRYSISGHANPVYTYQTPSFSTEELLSGLAEGTRYEISAKTYCQSGSESGWSQPVVLETSRCQPPFNPMVSEGSTEATLNWTSRPEATLGTALFVLTPGVPFVHFNLAGGVNQRLLSPLTPNKNYRIYFLSLCQDLAGSPAYLGQTYTTLDFRTLPLSGPGPRLESAIEQDMLLWPNPTSGRFEALFEGGSDPLHCRLLAEDGRVLQEAQVAPGTLFSGDLSGRSPGVYYLEWVETGQTKPILLVQP